MCAIGGRNRILAASPHKAAGLNDPFQDLLFSAQAAFVWDNTQRAITWMNAAARAKFCVSLKDLQAALPASTSRRFARYFDEPKGKPKRSGTAKLKIGPKATCDCTIEVLVLAGGHQGLIVAEADAARAAAGTAPAASPSPKHQAAAKKQPAKPAAPAPQLTAEELRAFKAIGRTVRRLADEKLRAAKPPAAPAPVRAAPQTPAAASAQPAPAQLFSAFDLVLFLDRNLKIVGSEGRPQRFGWRKAELQGKPAAHLLPPAERTVLHRMAKRLDSPSAQISRDALAFCDGAGAPLPCRAILGRWANGNAHYFLALLSLAMPARLKKLQPLACAITRLAA